MSAVYPGKHPADTDTDHIGFGALEWSHTLAEQAQLQNCSENDWNEQAFDDPALNWEE